MNIKSFLGCLTAGMALTLGVAVLGGTARINNQNLKVAEAATGDAWYLRGSRESWGAATDEYKFLDGGDALVLDMAAAEEFKIFKAADSWSADSLTTATGDAVSHWTEVTSGNWKQDVVPSSGNNTYVNVANTYALSVKDGALFIDFGIFYYSGSQNSWGTETGSAGNHPEIRVNGGPSTWTLAANETFKIRNNNWDYGVFSYGNLKDGDFYGSFTSADDGNGGVNIKCLIEGQYDISVSLKNHAWTIRAVPHGVNPDDTAFAYVLDLYGNKLNTRHQAYTFVDGGQAMGWPGATMATYEGTTHLYKQEFWTGMEQIIFNNKNGDDGMQTYDWDVSSDGEYSNRGKCLVLRNDVADGKWSSNVWIEPEAAKFIENFMHFQDFNESDVTDGTACKGNSGYYKLAKDAYDELTNDIKHDVCSLDYVVSRLQSWARANNGTFTLNNQGIGAFSANSSLIPIDGNSESGVVVVSVLSAISLMAIALFVFIKKKETI